jgi:hypothetical protein
MITKSGEPIFCNAGDIIVERNSKTDKKIYWFIYKVEPIKYKYMFKTYNINKAYCWDLEYPESTLSEMVFHETSGMWVYEKVSP